MPVALTASLGIILTPITIALLRRLAVVDRPNARSSHDRPTPRGAGIAPAIAVLAGLLLTSDARAVIAAAALFGTIGLIDDVNSLSARTRLVLQVLSALIVASLLPPESASVALIGAVLAIGFIVSFVNVFNFMDGINGISAAQILTAAVAWSVVATSVDHPELRTIAAVVGASVIGFVPWNFPRAHAFLGDVGSYSLGAALAIVAVLLIRRGAPVEAVIGPLMLYIADSATTLARRARRRVRLFDAHREHAYQQLVQGGWSHARTTLVITAFMGVTSALGALSLLGGRTRVVGDALALVVVIAYLALPGLQRRSMAPALA